MSNFRKSDASELVTRDLADNQRTYSPHELNILIDILEELKDINLTLKRVHNLEI